MLFNSLASGVRKRSHIPKQMEYFIFFVRHSMNPIYNPKNFRTCVSPWNISFFLWDIPWIPYTTPKISGHVFLGHCFAIIFFLVWRFNKWVQSAQTAVFKRSPDLWSWAWKANYDIHSKTEVTCIVGRNKVYG